MVIINNNKFYFICETQAWENKTQAKANHKGLFINIYDEYGHKGLMFCAHGSENGWLETSPNHFINHNQLLDYMIRKYSQKIKETCEARGTKEYVVYTHGCHDGARFEVSKTVDGITIKVKSITDYTMSTWTHEVGVLKNEYKDANPLFNKNKEYSLIEITPVK